MLVLAGSFSYTSRVSFSEESLLHSPCCFQSAMLGTLVFNHACMPDLIFSKRHQTIDFVQLHVGRQKSYSTLILHTEKESKSPEKRETNRKVCAVTARHPLHIQLAAHDSGSVASNMAIVGTRNLCCLHFSRCKCSIAPKRTLGLCTASWPGPIGPFKLGSGVSLTRPS